MADKMTECPIDPLAGLALAPGWYVQPEQQMAAKVEAKKKADEDDDSEDDDEDDSEDDDDPDADKDEDELREELKKTRDALHKANGQSAKSRGRRKALQQQLDEQAAELAALKASGAKPKPKTATTTEPTVDVEAIRSEERTKAQKASDESTKRSELKSALVDKGVSLANARLLVGDVDLDDLDIDPKTHEVDGLDEVIDQLKTDHAELFGAGRRRPGARISGKEDDGKGGKPKPKTASERQAAQLLG
jgi:hypothetical protein